MEFLIFSTFVWLFCAAIAVISPRIMAGFGFAEKTRAQVLQFSIWGFLVLVGATVIVAAVSNKKPAPEKMAAKPVSDYEQREGDVEQLKMDAFEKMRAGCKKVASNFANFEKETIAMYRAVDASIIDSYMPTGDGTGIGAPIMKVNPAAWAAMSPRLQTNMTLQAYVVEVCRPGQSKPPLIAVVDWKHPLTILAYRDITGVKQFKGF